MSSMLFKKNNFKYVHGHYLITTFGNTDLSFFFVRRQSIVLYNSEVQTILTFLTRRLTEASGIGNLTKRGNSLWDEKLEN